MDSNMSSFPPKYYYCNENDFWFSYGYERDVVVHQTCQYLWPELAVHIAHCYSLYLALEQLCSYTNSSLSLTLTE